MADQKLEVVQQSSAGAYQRLLRYMGEAEEQMRYLSKALPEEHERRFFADLRELQSQLTLQATAQEREFPSLQPPFEFTGVCSVCQQLVADGRKTHRACENGEGAA